MKWGVEEDKENTKSFWEIELKVYPTLFDSPIYYFVVHSINMFVCIEVENFINFVTNVTKKYR